MGYVLFLYDEIGTRSSRSHGLGALDLIERKRGVKAARLEIKSTNLTYIDVF